MNKVLATNLYKATKAVKRTELSTLPVLNHARLAYSDGWMTITTAALTDNGVEVTTEKAACIMNEEWSTCVPMVHRVDVWDNGKETKRKFYPFLDYLKVMAEFDEVLELDFDPSIQMLTVKAGTSRSQFKCIDAMEFPPC